MPVKELEMPVEAKTFKVSSVNTAPKEYHYMQRTVGMVALPDGTMRGDQLDAEVMYWLNIGFVLKEIHFLGQHKGADGNVHGYVYGYHFVKE